MPKKITNLVGQRFYRLVVKEYDYDKRKWFCVCDCGNTKYVTTSNLNSGGVKSCGCLHLELRTKHGQARKGNQTPEYQTWQGIKSRCYNTNDQKYNRYGARGIYVCDRWLNSFENFYADMGDKPGPEYSIDRINNDGPYSPENCRWATPEEQANNKSNNILLTHENKTYNLLQWSSITGIPYKILHKRFCAGWSTERILTQPTKPMRWTFNNETKTISEWAKECGIDDRILRERYRDGWSIREILTTPKYQHRK